MESFPLAHWLLLHYKIPTEPSASRVYVWRKLKRLGAYLLQDAVWVLPDTPRTFEQFQWLSAEIVEIGGEATFWRAQPALAGQDERLVEQFTGQVEAAYRELSHALDGAGADLENLSREYQRIKSRDYFNSEAGQRLREALIAVRGAEK
jgi:hypothetical protein